MGNSQQYAIILRKCANIEKTLQGLKKDLHNFASIQGTTTYELNALKKQVEVFVNQKIGEE